ncbi:MAG: glycosyltransferase [Phycisphaerae bacterium]
MISLSCNPLPPVRYGGIEQVISNLTRGLVAAGAGVTCYCPGTLGFEGARQVRTLPEPSPGPKEGVFEPNSPAHIDAIVAGLKSQAAPGDIIHLHHDGQWALLRPRLGWLWRQRRTFVETAHWKRTGLNRNVIYPSKALAEKIGHPGSVAAHGIDLDIFGPVSDRTRQGHLLYAGRVTPDKGVHLAVEACRLAGRELHIAGPLPDEAYAEQILPRCRWLGEMEPAQLAAAYRAAHGLVYLSQYTEPFGLAPVEAMACGCPVITTGCGGCGETVLDGRTGFFAETPEQIAQAVDKLDTLCRDDIIQRGRQYSIEAMTQKYLTFYRGLHA